MSKDKYVLNRKGERVIFDANRIQVAIDKAFLSENIIASDVVTYLTEQVIDLLF
eukprot:COSAG01_NODE_10799_length_2077_cov_7.011489_1_plen_53_part_10